MNEVKQVAGEIAARLRRVPPPGAGEIETLIESHLAPSAKERARQDLVTELERHVLEVRRLRRALGGTNQRLVQLDARIAELEGPSEGRGGS